MKFAFPIAVAATVAVAVTAASDANDLLRDARASLDKAADAFASATTATLAASLAADPVLDAWTVFSLPAIPRISIRTRKPRQLLCDSSVAQIVGYVDVDHETHTDHFFFWFFESRRDPANDPLVLWLNGGPGCSSMTGLFMELGPCRVKPGGKDTEFNKYSWNAKANLLFLDQPVNAGFSWTDGDQVASSDDAAVDVYGFLQLFLHQHKKFSKLPFFVTGESYAGHYIPAIGSFIHEQNSLLLAKKNDDDAALSKLLHINLAGLAIGNGLTDPLSQYEWYPEMACNNNYGPILPPQACEEMRGKSATCNRLIQACYTSGSRWACVPSSIYCNNAMIGPVQKSGVNGIYVFFIIPTVYDVRTKCEEGNPLCYGIIQDIETYLNQPEIQQMIGADREFKGCNMDVNLKFLMNGDWMKPYHTVLPPLLDDGIAILIYAGDADYICNWMGNKAWTLAMDWSGKDGFNTATDKPWTVSGRKAGEYRVHEGFSFLRVYEAGHMVPYDQPEASMAFIEHFTEMASKGHQMPPSVEDEL